MYEHRDLDYGLFELQDRSYSGFWCARITRTVQLMPLNNDACV